MIVSFDIVNMFIGLFYAIIVFFHLFIIIIPFKFIGVLDDFNIKGKVTKENFYDFVSDVWFYLLVLNILILFWIVKLS